jgi:FkbM family methyltransferase
MTDMGGQNLLGRVLTRLRYEATWARLFRGGIVKQRLYRTLGKRETSIQLSGIGRVTVRPRDTDVASFLGIFAGPEYDFPIPAVEASVRARCEEILSAGKKPVIVDAGAYVGASVLWFGSKFPQAHIVAIEPDPDSFALLERNLAEWNETTAVNAAVGSRAGQVKMVRSDGSWANQVERSEDGIRIVTMDEAFAMVPNGEPLMAKINIEGFEQDVFSANLDWLDRISILYLEPHDWLYPGRHTSRSFQKALGDRDFHLFIVGPHLCYARL